MMLRRDSYLSIVQQHDQARRCARCGLAEAVDAACCWCGTSGGNACCVLYLAAAAAAAAAADKLPCRMAGVSMRPSEAAKLDAAGERAAEEKGFLPGRPSWSSSTTNWGLRAYAKGGSGPVDVYLGDGENKAGEVSRAFQQAREDISFARSSQRERGHHADATLTRTLSNFSHRNQEASKSLHRPPGSDRYVGGGPKCRAHTREFCVPSVDTHRGVYAAAKALIFRACLRNGFSLWSRPVWVATVLS
jgi:hypothetical protein